AGSSCRRSSVVSLRLALSNPTLPEITDGYEIKLHHSMGHDLSRPPGSMDSPGKPGVSASFSPRIGGLICLIEWNNVHRTGRPAAPPLPLPRVGLGLRRQGQGWSQSNPPILRDFSQGSPLTRVWRSRWIHRLFLVQNRAVGLSILMIKHACKGPFSHAFLLCTKYLETGVLKAPW
ncbi:hypothetical protein GGD49_004980, partial [Rhizobium tropici]|nr:hypothetical protein [Rhizobium tropici]